MDFEQIPHTADLKIKAYGNTLEQLFTNALIGMFSSIKPKSKLITYTDDKPLILELPIKRHVKAKSDNLEFLLVDFLSECLYLSDVHNEAYFDAKFDLLTYTQVVCSVYGVKVTGFEVVEIKAVTYNDLKIEHSITGWTATVVFDI